jgi:NAD(P)-dependent dehydrogenase (short-subunit alcohol dehydrogenase family)
VTATRSPFDLTGRIAIVSGASRGIGEAIAAGLAAAGATVIGISRSVAKEAAGNARVQLRTCDVTDTEGFRALCGSVAAEHRRLDVYVHCAGVSYSSAEMPDESERFARTISVNLVAAYECDRTAAEHMIKSGGAGGSIVNVTSINSVQGFPGNPGYVASKGGLSALTRALALDLGGSGIRVNNLQPGYIRTAMTEASYSDPARNEQRLQRTILKRWGTAADLVGPAVFLASDASAYITGQDIVVDGGWVVKGL